MAVRSLPKTFDGSVSAAVAFPIPPLSVPLMSISKQVEDIMRKIMVIKEIIRQKAKMVIERLKSLQASELFIMMPRDFLLIMEVLIEIQFIYSNLHIVMDRILEFFINLLVQRFAEIADRIIAQIFDIWQ